MRLSAKVSGLTGVATGRLSVGCGCQPEAWRGATNVTARGRRRKDRRAAVENSGAIRYLGAVRLPLRFSRSVVAVLALSALAATHAAAQRLESLWYVRGEASIQSFL